MPVTITRLGSSLPSADLANSTTLRGFMSECPMRILEMSRAAFHFVRLGLRSCWARRVSACPARRERMLKEKWSRSGNALSVSPRARRFSRYMHCSS